MSSSSSSSASGKAIAAFEEGVAKEVRLFSQCFLRLEEENAELRARLAAAMARLALYEPQPLEEPPFLLATSPTAFESTPSASPAPSPLPIPVPAQLPPPSSPAPGAASLPTSPAPGGQSSKFTAVKNFLFKPKAKMAEDETKAGKLAEKDRDAKKKGDPPELWAGPDRSSRSKGGSKKKLTDRWVFSRLLEGHTKAVDEVTVCNYDPYIVASCSRDGSARLWTLDNIGSAVFTGHKPGSVVNSIRIHNNSMTRFVCTAGSDGTVQIFKIPLFMMHQKSPKDGLSRRGSGGGAGGLSDSPRMSPDISDDDSISATPPLTPRQMTPRQQMSTPRGSVVPSLSTPQIEVKAVVTLPVVSVFSEHTDSVVACDWINGADQIVSGSTDSTLKIIDVTTLQAQSIAVQFPTSDNSPQLTNVFSHPSAPRVIAPGSDGLARVWDLREQKLVDLIAHSSDKACVSHALFSHDGGLIITGGDDRLVKLWDARNTQTALDAIRCGSLQSKFALSQRTNTLVIPMRDGKVKICDTQGHNVGACETHKQHKEGIACAVWSQDETSLFSSSLDDKNNLIVWTREGKEK